MVSEDRERKFNDTYWVFRDVLYELLAWEDKGGLSTADKKDILHEFS